MLKVEDVTVEYAPNAAGTCAVRALDGVSLRCAPERIVGVVGTRGSGKTTLLKVCAGLLPVKSGLVRIGGEPVATAGHAKAGYAPMEGLLPGGMSAHESFGYIAKLRNLPRLIFEDRLTKLAYHAGVSTLMHRPGHSLSDGERLRVSLVGALLHEPAVVLLDASRPHPDARDALHAHLRRLASEGRAVLVSADALSDLGTLCDETFALHHGRLSRA